MGVPQSAVVYTIDWFKINTYNFICYQLAPIDFCEQIEFDRQDPTSPYIFDVDVVGEGVNRQCLTASEEERLMNATK